MWPLRGLSGKTQGGSTPRPCGLDPHCKTSTPFREQRGGDFASDLIVGENLILAVSECPVRIRSLPPLLRICMIWSFSTTAGMCPWGAHAVFWGEERSCGR